MYFYNEIKLLPHPIHKLIAQGESQHLDFKFEISDALKIARTLVAFANTDGGTLLIGVEDNGTITGIRSGEEIFMAETAAKKYCTPEIPIQYKEWDVYGKNILEATVFQGTNKPYFVVNKQIKKAYIRMNDQNIAANAILLSVWKKKSKNKGAFIRFSDSEKELLSFINTHPNTTLSAICKNIHLHRKKAERLLTNFILTDSIEMLFSEKGVSFSIKNTNDEREQRKR
ncbi:MAG: ATP-binding protein [Lentimicrobiaceae bacterium]|nr:ATP-binding protein [Lentimicrobiaceae bacterium]